MLFRIIVGFLLVFLFSYITPATLSAAVPELSLVPAGCAQEKTLLRERESLEGQMKDLMHAVKANKARCGSVDPGSALEADCLEEGKRIKQRYAELVEKYKEFNNSVECPIIIKQINTLALKLEWNADERGRLNRALNSLQADGAWTSEDARLAWSNVLARGQDEALAQEAAQGVGRGFPGAGKQKDYNDCAIYALSNATGRPYGYVAALANKFISEGEWRNAAERANPQKEVFKTGGGLNGGEVIMLAEALGQTDMVPSSAFAKTLKEGRTVIVCVVPPNGDFNFGHAVVLSKTFQHNGGTWYEMIDSNQGGPWQRRYLSEHELQAVIKENGVAFRPEPGTTPKLLRSEGE